MNLPAKFGFATIPFRKIWAVALVAIVLPAAWLGPLDTNATEYVESGLKRALVTFAVARTANAVISVMQETTVAVSPGGVGVTAGVGQVLDPLNDLVEQFSALMLAACVSLGIQRALISLGGLAVVSASLTILLLAWTYCCLRSRSAPPLLTRAVILLMFIRFAVPLAALGSEAAFHVALSNQYNEAHDQVDLATRPTTEAGSPPDMEKKEGLIRRTLRRASEWKGDVLGKMDEFRTRAESAVRHIVILMALFIVQTMILPILFLWLLFRLFGAGMNWQTITPKVQIPRPAGT